MDVDGNRVIQEVLTVYPQVIPQIVDNLLFRGKAWILYIVDCFFFLIICSVYNIKLGKKP